MVVDKDLVGLGFLQCIFKFVRAVEGVEIQTEKQVAVAYGGFCLDRPVLVYDKVIGRDSFREKLQVRGAWIVQDDLGSRARECVEIMVHCHAAAHSIAVRFHMSDDGYPSCLRY